MNFVEFDRENIETSVPKRFEQQVEKFPTRVAIRTRSQELTYKELNEMANSIARVICTKCSRGPETVALYFEPGIKMIAAILAVLKSGKIWIPLDKSHPRDRISYIVKDSQARFIVSDNEGLFPTRGMVQEEHSLINLDEIDYDMNNQNLDFSPQPDDYAHIIYTSGSTGQPKGVIHSHRLILHNIRGHTNSLRICPDDRISLLSSLSHLAGISDLFRALLNGATLLPYNLRREGFVNFATWFLDEQITVYHSVPTVFRQFVNALHGNEQFPRLRIIHLGGEPVLNYDVELYQKHFSSSCILVVILGATEAPTFRQNLIYKDTPITRGIVPVGYAVEDKEVLILDERGHRIDDDRVGEIAVCSRYLASGYWRRPELTNKAFIEDSGGNVKIYKTGDQGQMLPNGSLIYLGRKDKQVKIGGQRIEIGEIETALHGHLAIKSCAVIAKENNFGDKYLAAYYVPQNTAPTVGELLNYLKLRLPDYMIPTRLILMEELPSLPDGKIDRKALQGVDDASRPYLETAIVLPRNDVECRLKNIWEQVLGVQPIGINDNFFELGGSSLCAASLLTLIEKTFDIKLALSELYQVPTIEQLSKLLNSGVTPAAFSSPSLIPLRSGGLKPPFFCLPGNLGNVFTDLSLLSRLLGADQPFYGLQDGLGNPVRIEKIASFYLEQIQSVQPGGYYFLGGVCSGGAIAFEIAQQLQKKGQKVALLAMIEPSRRHRDKSVAYYGVLRFMFLSIMRRIRKQYYRILSSTNMNKKIKPLPMKAFELKTLVCLKLKVVANVWALRRYIPESYQGQIDFFVTKQTVNMHEDLRKGWAGLAAKGANFHLIPGNHNTITGFNETIIEPAHIRVLAEKLKSSIDRALDDLEESDQTSG